ncbi:hypothetical protein TWF696_003833 [Orbilia brochopaga]|uniref:Uncharacterized protein n=1 Tax=Orbilia brochopaga TaxID=3140254 RepID=A0AAV9V5I7_9PEZI
MPEIEKDNGGGGELALFFWRWAVRLAVVAWGTLAVVVVVRGVMQTLEGMEPEEAMVVLLVLWGAAILSIGWAVNPEDQRYIQSLLWFLAAAASLLAWKTGGDFTWMGTVFKFPKLPEFPSWLSIGGNSTSNGTTEVALVTTAPQSAGLCPCSQGQSTPSPEPGCRGTPGATRVLLSATSHFLSPAVLLGNNHLDFDTHHNNQRTRREHHRLERIPHIPADRFHSCILNSLTTDRI